MNDELLMIPILPLLMLMLTRDYVAEANACGKLKMNVRKIKQKEQKQ